MAIGDPISIGFSGAGRLSDWGVIYDDATTACDAGDFTDLAAIDNEQFHWCKVPDKATLCQVRLRTTNDATTYTALPVIEIWGLDSNGVPQRIDQDDQSSTTRITLNLDSAQVEGVSINSQGIVVEDAVDGYVYGDVSIPSGQQGYDVKGSKWIGTPVRTAAAITDGASNLTVEVLMRFLDS